MVSLCAMEAPNEAPHFRIYGDYVGREPAFWDADDFPWVETLRRAFPVVREEFEDHVRRRGRALRPNRIADDVQLTGWLGVNFFTCLRRYERNCRAFPRTVAMLESIPNLCSAFLNLLEPHSYLPPHFGEANLFHRAHLGVVVPGGVDECGMEVDGERHGWTEGEVFVFNDARRHHVWNRSDRPRVVLIVDVLKPQYGEATARTCGRVLGSIALMYLHSRIATLRRLPRGATRALHASASLPFQTYLALFGQQRRRPRRAVAPRELGAVTTAVAGRPPR
jgi:aspartyl/asparaginyl beta-hydroxylase (cupin superfamily)